MLYNMFAVISFASIRTWDSLSVKERRGYMCIPYSCNEVYDQWWQYTPIVLRGVSSQSSASFFSETTHIPSRAQNTELFAELPRNAISINHEYPIYIWIIRVVICKTYNDTPLGHDPPHSIKNILWAFWFKNSSAFLKLRSTGICSRSSLLSTSLRRRWGCSLAWACLGHYGKHWRGARNWRLFRPWYTSLFRGRRLGHFSWELRGSRSSRSPGRASWVGTGSLRRNRRIRRHHGWVCMLAHWHLGLVHCWEIQIDELAIAFSLL